ncbi:MAG: NHLP bacteriocin export ABC transporter permease/ATPase subunit [Scytonematopsis contorta HA4267-MV1]|jgi:ATP-binding cassette subfamily C protein|nr:NHLP bacteriocin export ABC transporter permease/ATPase subunit [Scytonematopsis contorta HA4267-MV1]
MQGEENILNIFNGNEPILLNDPSQVWVVQSGSMGLFAVTVKDGVVESNRRYLCDITKGEALFGAAVISCNQILAVPIGETELLKISKKSFSLLIANKDTQAITWVENWVSRLGTTLSHINMPAIPVKAEEKTLVSLNSGQTLQATFQDKVGVVRWVQIQQGSVGFIGFPELTLTDTVTTFPFSYPMWLEALEEVEVIIKRTTELSNFDSILTGLLWLHANVLNCVYLLDEKEAQEEWQKLHERQNLHLRAKLEAIKGLASVLDSQNKENFFEAKPLLAAAGAVGKAMGINIRPTADSENLEQYKEPLEGIARASRVRIRQVILQDKWWLKDGGALVAYTKEDHQPVALLPITANRYEIFDPVKQTRLRVDGRVASKLSHEAYMFYRSFPEKAIAISDALKFAVKGRKQDIVTIVLTGIAVTLLGMLTPVATGIIMGNAIPDSDGRLLLQIGLVLLVAAFGAALFQLVQGFAILRMETAVDISIQAAVWDRLLKEPVSFFRQYTTGDLVSRVSSISTIRRQLSGRTLISLISSIFALFYLGQLFYYNSQLALVAVVVAIITLSITTYYSLLLLRQVRPLLEVRGNIFGQTVQIINGISKLRIAGAEERAFVFWSKNYGKQVKLELRTQQIEDAVAVFNSIIPIFTSGLLFWFAANLLQDRVQDGQTAVGAGISLGTFLAFNTAFDNFSKGTTELSNTVTETLQVIPEWKRTQPILQTLPEVNLRKTDPGKLTGKIIVDNIKFRYGCDSPLTLDNLNIQAQAGEFIALVGTSGSGKSTLLRLLLGFETPESGTIYYDGHDLSALDVEAVRRQMGVVLQNGQVLSASIFDNIGCGARITLEQAWEAAYMAGLAEDIAKMPMSMHTVISEGGGNISGGQRQRLLIARALALKPRILLFDEATSALDNRTQAIVSESLEQLKVTRIVIAHRLSTIRNANRIYVLQKGRIVQQGNFQELASVEGLFADLMHRQTTS